MKTKKLISIIIGLCLIISSFAFLGTIVSAEEKLINSADGKWEFYANDSKMTATLVFYDMTGYYENFRFPEKIVGENGKEYTVDNIGSGDLSGEIFKENLSVKNLIIPKTVVQIRGFAFGFNKTIKTVTIENGTLPLEIGGCAFYYCPLIETVNFGNRTSHIYYNCFTDCPSLKTVVLPKNIEFVEFGAFDAKYVYIYNSNCVLENHCFNDGTVIYGIENSTAQKYAKNNTCKFKLLVNCYLDNTKYNYNRKIKTPNIVVKDYRGKIIEKEYYSVSYQSGRKNIGSYQVKIKLNGVYKGTVTKIFTIYPKKTLISKVSPEEKGFTVKWKNQSIQTNGYEIQYSTNKKMNKNLKNITVKSNGTISKTVRKLQGNKKYYIRVRTFKKIGSKKYYSEWSNIKYVTTKK